MTAVPQDGPASKPPTQTCPVAQPPASPAPASALPLQPVVGGAQVQVSLMQTAGEGQRFGLHGPVSSTAASSNVQSDAEAGVATLPVARLTFERTLPLSPASMTRNAMTGTPLTTSILL